MERIRGCGRTASVAVMLGCALFLQGCAEVGRSGELDDMETLPRFRLVEDLRIGSVEDPAAGFTQIGGVAVHRSGTVYVLETRDRHIRVYDSAGQRLRTIGGPGEGPGELLLRGGSARFGFLADTLWLHDPGVPRLTLFAPEGAVLATVATASVLHESAPGVTVMLRADRYLGDGLFSSLYAIPAGAMSTISTSPDPILAPVVRMRADGTVVDTLRWERLRGSSARGIEVMGQRVTVPQPPDTEPLSLTAPADVYRVERPVPTSAEDARATVVRLQGRDTVYRRELRYAPRPWSPGYVNRLIEPVVRLWANRVGPAADTALAAAAVREALDFPPLQPAVSALHLGDDGVLWMAREPDPDAPTTWVMIDSQGVPLGTVEVPTRATVHWSAHGTVWASVLDPLDVPWLVRYAVSPAGGSRP